MVVLWCNALKVFPRTTLAGFTPVLIWLAARHGCWFLVVNGYLLVVNSEITFWFRAEDGLDILGNNSFSKRCLEYVVST